MWSVRRGGEGGLGKRPQTISKQLTGAIDSKHATTCLRSAGSLLIIMGIVFGTDMVIEREVFHKNILQHQFEGRTPSWSSGIKIELELRSHPVRWPIDAS